MKTMIELLTDETPIKCFHCGHKWDYKGKNPYYVTCPYCRSQVSVRKYKVLQTGDSPQSPQSAETHKPSGFDSNG